MCEEGEATVRHDSAPATVWLFDRSHQRNDLTVTLSGESASSGFYRLKRWESFCGCQQYSNNREGEAVRDEADPRTEQANEAIK